MAKSSSTRTSTRESFSSSRPMLPSTWATASSRNNSVVRLCSTEKPSRQAFCARAQASQLFADTRRSDEEDILILAHPFTGGERAEQLAVQAAWMLVIDIFDHATFFQPGRLQAPRQRTILSPKPLLIDEHRKAFLEAELAGIGGFQLRMEGIGHSVQFHGLKFFNRWLVQHGSFLKWLLQQRCRRIVVIGATHVLMAWPRLTGFQIECGLPVKRALQDRAQTGVVTGLQLQRPLAGRFEPLVGIGLG